MDLPLEVVENILCRLWSHHDLYTASLVCRGWSQLVRESGLVWRARFNQDFCYGANSDLEDILLDGAKRIMQYYPPHVVYATQAALRRRSQSPLLGTHNNTWLWDVYPIGEQGAASCSDSGQLKKWSISNGELLCVSEVETKVPLTDVVVNEEGHALTCGLDGNFRLCDLESKKVMRTYPSDFVARMALSGETVLCAGMDDCVRVFHGLMQSEGRVRESHLRGHSDWVRSICFVERRGHGDTSSDVGGNAAESLSSSDDSTICLFDLERETLRLKMYGPPSQASAVAASFDGRLAASGHTGGCLRLWDLREGRPILDLNVNSREENPHSLVFSKDGVVLIGGSDKRLSMWDIRSTSEILSQSADTGVTSVRLSKSGANLFACSGKQLACTQLRDPANLHLTKLMERLVLY